MTRRKKAIEQTVIPEREHKALELRKQGWSYRKIANQLGISFQQAYKDVQNELKDLAQANENSAGELRQMELERLDRIIDGLDHWVQAGNAPAAMAILKAIDTRAKLLGLYTPQQLEVLTWEDRAVQDIKSGLIKWDDFVNEFGDKDLATRLFARAGISISSE